jgi:hypothetical protein
VIFYFKKIISAQEVLELFFPSIAKCRKLKIQKSTSPTGHSAQAFKKRAVASLIVAFRRQNEIMQVEVNKKKVTYNDIHILFHIFYPYFIYILSGSSFRVIVYVR